MTTLAPPTVVTWRGLFELLGASERAAIAAHAAVFQLHRQGIATPQDDVAYDRIRADLYAAQVAIIVSVRQAVAQVDDNLVERVPLPLPLPAADMPGGAGLGNPAVLIAGVLIALFEIAAIAWLLNETAHMAFTTWEQLQRIDARAQQYAALLAARQQAYAACVAAGTLEATCAQRAVSLVPTPEDAGLAVELNASPGTSWTPVLVGGGALLGLGVLGWWFFGRKAPAPTMRGLGAPHRVLDLDGSKSRYNLEV